MYIIFHFLVRNMGCGIDKAILDVWYLYQLVDDRVDFSYVHIRYFIGYVYHICLQDTIQSTPSLCLLCQAMLLPMPLRPLLLNTRSGFNVAAHATATSAPDHPVWFQRSDQIYDVLTLCCSSKYVLHWNCTYSSLLHRSLCTKTTLSPFANSSLWFL